MIGKGIEDIYRLRKQQRKLEFLLQNETKLLCICKRFIIWMHNRSEKLKKYCKAACVRFYVRRVSDSPFQVGKSSLVVILGDSTLEPYSYFFSLNSDYLCTKDLVL